MRHIVVNATVSRESKPAPEQDKPGPWMTFLNSPFIVTMLGGLLLALASHLWQQNAADLTFRRQRWMEMMKERRDAAKEFSSRMSGAIYTVQVAKRREIWIRSSAGKAGVIFPDGRNFQEERTFYEAMIQKSYSGTTADGLVSLVRSTFTSLGVQEKAAALQKELDDLTDTSEEAKLPQLISVLNGGVDALVDAINAEIVAVGARLPET